MVCSVRAQHGKSDFGFPCWYPRIPLDLKGIDNYVCRSYGPATGMQHSAYTVGDITIKACLQRHGEELFKSDVVESLQFGVQ